MFRVQKTEIRTPKEEWELQGRTAPGLGLTTLVSPGESIAVMSVKIILVAHRQVRLCVTSEVWSE